MYFQVKKVSNGEPHNDSCCVGRPMGERYAFVMIIQNKWWQEFRRNNLHGEEIRSYVQKGLAPPRDTSLILFYVAKPVGEIAGYAEFVERKTGDSEELWKKYGGESVLSSGE